MIRRMLRAAYFDGRVYQELPADPTATLQAFSVVLLGGISLGLGLSLGFFQQGGLFTYIWVMTKALTAVLAVWVILGLFGYILGLGALHRAITFPTMLRALGFANTPGLLYIFIGIGVSENVALVINAVVFLWVLLATSVAVSRVLQLGPLGSFVLSVIGMGLGLFLRQLIIL